MNAKILFSAGLALLPAAAWLMAYTPWAGLLWCLGFSIWSVGWNGNRVIVLVVFAAALPYFLPLGPARYAAFFPTSSLAWDLARAVGALIALALLVKDRKSEQVTPESVVQMP